jgi:hypothetical protein
LSGGPKRHWLNLLFAGDLQSSGDGRSYRSLPPPSGVHAMLFVLPILSSCRFLPRRVVVTPLAMISANIATVRYRFRRIFGRSFAIDHFKNEAIQEDEACVRNHWAQGIIDRLELRGKVSVTTSKRCRLS